MQRTDDLIGWALAVTLAVTAVAMWPDALNAYEPIKFAVLALGAATIAALAITTPGWTASRLRPVRPHAIAVGVVVAVMLVATLASTYPANGLVGARGRFTGVLPYVAHGTLLLAAATLDRRGIRRVLTVLAFTGGFVALVGALQAVGVPLLEGIGSEVGSHSTLGNINFASAYVGMTTAAALWWTVHAGGRWPVGAAVLVIDVAYLLLSSSFQGVPTAAAACAPVLAHLLWTRGGAWRSRALPAAGALAAVAAVLVVLGVAQVGPLSALGAEEGVELRRGYWAAAVDMLAENPVLGVGPEDYQYAFRTSRTFDAAQDLDLLLDNDAAHDVLLHHAASGGILLLLAVLALWGLVGRSAWKGSRAADVDGRLLAAGGGIALGYVVQGLVSIDVPAVASLGWAALGLVVAASRPPGTDARGPRPTTKTAKKRAARRHRPTPARLAAAGVLLLVVLVGAFLPTVAEVRAAGAVTGDVDAARGAVSAGFWEPRYEEGLALAFLAAGRTEDGLDLMGRLYDQDTLTAPGAIRVARGLATEDPPAAVDWYRRSLELEPLHPELRVEAARFLLERGEEAEATEIAEGLLADDPADAAAQEVLDAASSRDAP